MPEKQEKEPSHQQQRFKNSIRFVIPLGIIIILGLVFLLVGRVLIKEQRGMMMDEVTTYGSDLTEFIAAISIAPLQKFSYFQLENYIVNLEKGEFVSRCTIFDERDIPLFSSTATDHQFDSKDNFRIFSAPIEEDGNLLGRVEIVIDLTVPLSEINRTSIALGLALAILILLIGFALSVFLHRRVVSPIGRLAETTRKLESGELPHTDLLLRSDEIGQLAASIHDTSNRLKRLYRDLENRVDERTAELNAAKIEAEQASKSHLTTKEELQNLLDNSPVGIAFISFERIIERVNPEFCAITGYSEGELIGQPSRILYANKEAYEAAEQTTIKILKRDGFCQTTIEFQHKDKTVITCALRGRTTTLDNGTIGVVWTLEDITTRLRMEAELLKIKKLESIGELAGGLAHDFNNILVAIIGNLSLAERLINDNQQVRDLISSARTASIKAKDLTANLLTFARKRDTGEQHEQLPEIIREEVNLVASGTHLHTHFSMPEDLWPVQLDKSDLKRIIENLTVNAIQSTPVDGRLDISCSNMRIGEGFAEELAAGRYLQIVFSDNGRGIPKDNIDRVFDPYFTTRARDSTRGMGLGLAVVHSIIAKLGGTIRVSSPPGEGTRFTMLLPAAGDGLPTPTGEVPLLPSGKGLILVIDRDESSYPKLAEMLSFLGYSSLHAESGAKALDICQQPPNEEPIRAVIIDLHIAGKKGDNAVVTQLSTDYPHLPLFLSSGHSDAPVLGNYQQAGFAAIITKPYQLLELSRTITGAVKH